MSDVQGVGVGVTQLGYLGIGVSDIRAWRSFAGDVLGLQENHLAADGTAYFRMDHHHHRIALAPTGEDDLIYAGWQAKDAAAVRSIAHQARSLGVKVVEGSREEATARRVLGLIHLEDPDGLRTEVYYGPLLDRSPFNSPRGVARFVADDLGLGHILMRVSDSERSLRFYVDVLGAKLTDYIHVVRDGKDMVLTFAHVNARHHSLALIDAPAPVRGVRQQRLGHFMMEVGTLDDVGMAFDRVHSRGLPCRTIGRHTNDLMTSFYVATPSGFNIEYGCGGRVIDQEKWVVQHYYATNMWGHAHAKVDRGPGAPILIQPRVDELALSAGEH